MLLWGLAVVNLVVTGTMFAASRRYAAEHTRIATAADLLDYRRFVGVQMWGALAAMGLVFLIPVVAVAEQLMTGEDAFSWWPVGLILVPALARKQIQEAENRCRGLEAAANLRAAYEVTNQIWCHKPFPRFPPLSQQREGADGDDPAAPSASGAAASVAPCVRCGGGVVNGGVPGGATGLHCEACVGHYRQVRVDSAPGERASKIAAHIVLGLAVGELCFGLLMLFDDLDPGMRTAGALGALLGGVGFVGGNLWAWNQPLGRKLSMAAAVPHLLVFPVGTIVAVFVLIVGFRHCEITSMDYREAVRVTRDDAITYVVVGTLAGVASMFFYGLNLLMLLPFFALFVGG